MPKYHKVAEAQTGRDRFSRFQFLKVASNDSPVLAPPFRSFRKHYTWPKDPNKQIRIPYAKHVTLDCSFEDRLV